MRTWTETWAVAGLLDKYYKWFWLQLTSILNACLGVKMNFQMLLCRRLIKFILSTVDFLAWPMLRSTASTRHIPHLHPCTKNAINAK